MENKVTSRNAEFKDRIQELLLCNICFECLTEPKTLQCQHTFCLNCLQKLVLKRQEEEGKKFGITVRCPTCRKIQENIKTKTDLSFLGVSLYVKQALSVIKDYENARNTNVVEYSQDEDSNENPAIANLLEDCHLIEDDRTPLPKKSSECDKITNLHENENDLMLSQTDFETSNAIDSEAKTSECSNPSVMSDEDDIIITQRFTFGKICNRIFNKKDSDDGDTSLSKTVAKKHKKIAPNNENIDTSDNPELKSSKKYVPKYIQPTTTLQRGLGLRPRYMPGSLNNRQVLTRPVTGFGYGIHLRHPPQSYAATSNISNDSHLFSGNNDNSIAAGHGGPFGPVGHGRTHPFMPPLTNHHHCHQPKKLMFVMKF